MFLLTFLIITTSILIAGASPYPKPQCYYYQDYGYGDVDNDGFVTEKDANIVRQHAIRGNIILDTTKQNVADADGDGNITIKDAEYIEKFARGEINYLPVCHLVKVKIIDTNDIYLRYLGISVDQKLPDKWWLSKNYTCNFLVTPEDKGKEFLCYADSIPLYAMASVSSFANYAWKIQVTIPSFGLGNHSFTCLVNNKVRCPAEYVNCVRKAPSLSVDLHKPTENIAPGEEIPVTIRIKSNDAGVCGPAIVSLCLQPVRTNYYQINPQFIPYEDPDIDYKTEIAVWFHGEKYSLCNTTYNYLVEPGDSIREIRGVVKIPENIQISEDYPLSRESLNTQLIFKALSHIHPYYRFEFHKTLGGQIVDIVINLSDTNKKEPQEPPFPPKPPQKEPLVSIPIKLEGGWNLVSVPLVDAVFNPIPKPRFYKDYDYCQDSDFIAIYGFENGQYKRLYSLSELEFGRGYWFKMRRDCYLIVEGYERSIDDFPPLSPGWNLIGSVTGVILFKQSTGTCNVLSGPWSYNTTTNQYELVGLIEQGKGYWVKVENTCELGNIPPPPPQ